MHPLVVSPNWWTWKPCLPLNEGVKGVIVHEYAMAYLRQAADLALDGGGSVSPVLIKDN